MEVDGRSETRREATVLRYVERAWDGAVRRFRGARRRSAKFDHVIRAYERYDEVYGARLAAANAYYGFFAVFALAVLLLGILGYLLRDNALVVGAVQRYLEANLPQVKVANLIGTTQNIGKLAVIGLALAGIGWVETLRSSQRAIWGLEQHPGNFVIRWLVDVAVLVGTGVLLTVSVSIASGLQDLVLGALGEPKQSAIRVIFNQFGTVLAAVVDLILGAAVLAAVPRIRMPLRRLFPSALLIAVGLLALKTVGRYYISRTQHNPAYAVFASAVGLLVFMYLFSQVVLFAAALAATSPYGRARDLATGEIPVVRDDDPAAPPPPPSAPAEPPPPGSPKKPPATTGKPPAAVPPAPPAVGTARVTGPSVPPG